MALTGSSGATSTVQYSTVQYSEERSEVTMCSPPTPGPGDEGSERERLCQGQVGLRDMWDMVDTGTDCVRYRGDLADTGTS